MGLEIRPIDLFFWPIVHMNVLLFKILLQSKKWRHEYLLRYSYPEYQRGESFWSKKAELIDGLLIVIFWAIIFQNIFSHRFLSPLDTLPKQTVNFPNLGCISCEPDSSPREMFSKIWQTRLMERWEAFLCSIPPSASYTTPGSKITLGTNTIFQILFFLILDSIFKMCIFCWKYQNKTKEGACGLQLWINLGTGPEVQPHAG